MKLIELLHQVELPADFGDVMYVECDDELYPVNKSNTDLLKKDVNKRLKRIYVWKECVVFEVEDYNI